MAFTYRTIKGSELTWAELDENFRLVDQYHDDSAFSANSAVAAANFKGNWNTLTGALNIPASVRHSSKYWMLVNNLANVTTSQPGVSADWVEIIQGNVSGPASSVNGGVPTFSGTTGKILQDSGKSLPAGTILGTSDSQVVTNKDLSSGTNTFPTTLATKAATREKLGAGRTYYVRTDGNDSNTGLTNTSGGAFLTIQKAVDVVSTLDIDTYTVTIQVADGTYTGATVLKSFLGSGLVIIQGNVATPANCILATSGSLYTFTHAQGGPGVYQIQGFTISGYLGFGAANYCKMNVQNVVMGTITNYDFYCYNGGVINIIGNFTISGNCSTVFYTSGLGVINVSAGITITLSGTRAWSNAFAYADRLSEILCYGLTISGSATGTRYTVIHNSVVFTNAAGATFFPGSVAGTTATGGQYI